MLSDRRMKLREIEEAIDTSHASCFSGFNLQYLLVYEEAFRKMSALFAHDWLGTHWCDNFGGVFHVIQPQTQQNFARRNTKFSWKIGAKEISGELNTWERRINGKYYDHLPNLFNIFLNRNTKTMQHCTHV